MIVGSLAAVQLGGVALGQLSLGQPGHAAARGQDLHAPELDQPGQQVSLAAYAGQPVIVNFFASWCTPCKKETPLLAKFYTSSHGKVVIIGVDANDEAGPAKKFVQAADVTYPVGRRPVPGEDHHLVRRVRRSRRPSSSTPGTASSSRSSGM